MVIACLGNWSANSSTSRYIVRDFTYDSEAIEKGKVDLVALEVNEKELWVSRRLDHMVNLPLTYQNVVGSSSIIKDQFFRGFTSFGSSKGGSSVC